jgi:N-methylhydantoinase B/oxoprolinase/acetone carboxylase alpha subunit
MTNTRLTDPEVLEFRYPVLLESYAIRNGSGGAGRWHGGSGGTRRVRFLEKMTASILANNRSIAPFGMAGGSAGAPGRNWVERVDGTRDPLHGRVALRFSPARPVFAEVEWQWAARQASKCGRAKFRPWPLG